MHNIVSHTGEEKPALTDLLPIIPKYAARWREIGKELELKHYHLEIIDLDNAYHPYRTTQCFRCVLEQWLKEISSPTWGKLDDAIQGIILLSSYIANTVGSGLRGTVVNAYYFKVASSKFHIVYIHMMCIS